MNSTERSAKVQTYMVQLQLGRIRGNQMEVLDFIWKNEGTTIHEMRTVLFIQHQSITPAVSSLLDLGMIKEIGREEIKDSVYSKYAFVPDAEEQNALAEARLKDKFRAWAKMGLKEYADLMPTELLEELNLLSLKKWK